MKDDRYPGFVKRLMSTRRLVKTIIGQLFVRFQIEFVIARDLWHLTCHPQNNCTYHRYFLNRKLNRESLQFYCFVEA